MQEDLKDYYRHALGAKIKSIKENLIEMRAGSNEAEKNLRTLAHSLHGSGKTYGFPDISQAAKAVEHADKKQFLKELIVLITVLQDVAKEPKQTPETYWHIQDNEKKILVIEDDEDISSLLDLVLRKKFAEFEIEICSNAVEAQTSLQSTNYDLIILALILKDSDGRTILRHIKSGHNKDAPVFILSSIDNDQIQTECRQLGDNGGQQYLRADHNHRFGAHDTMLEAGFMTNPVSGLPIDVAVAYTDQADFMPEYLVRLGSRWVLREASADPRSSLGTTVLTGQLQQSGYGNGDVKRVLVGLKYYLLNANAWLTPSIGIVSDQDNTETFAWTLGAHWQMTGNTRVGLSYSDAPETENQITTDTKNYQIYAQQALGSKLSLLLYFSRHERVNSYTRENLNLSLQYRY